MSRDNNIVNQMTKYLNCPYTLINPMNDDDNLMEQFSAACEQGKIEGFTPMLISADDATLLECLLMAVNENSDGESFDSKDVVVYRKKMLSMTISDGKATLDSMISERRGEVIDDGGDWGKDLIGKEQGGDEQTRFLSIWDYDTNDTNLLILAKIPVKNPWEVFAYLPFGGWNDCPDTPTLMAASKYWFEKYGAIPAVITHDQLEFQLKKPVPKDDAFGLALEQYGFCPDIVDQGVETVGELASQLSKSTVWYFWWD